MTSKTTRIQAPETLLWVLSLLFKFSLTFIISLENRKDVRDCFVFILYCFGFLTEHEITFIGTTIYTMKSYEAFSHSDQSQQSKCGHQVGLTIPKMLILHSFTYQIVIEVLRAVFTLYLLELKERMPSLSPRSESS